MISVLRIKLKSLGLRADCYMYIAFTFCGSFLHVGWFSLFFSLIFRTGERLPNLKKHNRMQNVLWYAWIFCKFCMIIFTLQRVLQRVRRLGSTSRHYRQTASRKLILVTFSTNEVLFTITSLRWFLLSGYITIGLDNSVSITTYLQKKIREVFSHP